MNNTIAAGLVLLSFFAANNVFAKSPTSNDNNRPPNALNDSSNLSDLESASDTPNTTTPIPDSPSTDTRSVKAKARADSLKAEIELTKYCAESTNDKSASDVNKAERDRICAAKAAKEAAQEASDAQNEKIREYKARQQEKSEQNRALRDVLNEKMAALKAVDEINEESPESVNIRIGSGDPILGKQKSQLCQGCHGLRGYSLVTLVPKLAGQYANYIVKELRNFQEGTRSNQIMSAMASTVPEDDLADIGAYFASQTKMAGGNHREDPLGKNLFLNGDPTREILPCVNCHGSNGKGRRPWTAIFPVVGGQHKDYLRLQLNNFKNSLRTNSPAGIMNKMSSNLTEAEIEGLADYMSSR